MVNNIVDVHLTTERGRNEVPSSNEKHLTELAELHEQLPSPIKLARTNNEGTDGCKFSESSNFIPKCQEPFTCNEDDSGRVTTDESFTQNIMNMISEKVNIKSTAHPNDHKPSNSNEES